MIKHIIFALFLAVVVGGSSAFYRPAAPYQVPSEGSPAFMGMESSFDSGLDNMEIETDGNISPSRKCGFCMGWSGQTNCPVSGL